MSFWKEFKDKLNKEVEKSPELQQTLNELEKLRPKTKTNDTEPTNTQDTNTPPQASKLDAAKEYIKKWGDSSKGAFSSVGQKVKEPLSGVRDKSSTVLGSAKQNWEKISETLKSKTGKATEGTGKAFETVKSATSGPMYRVFVHWNTVVTQIRSAKDTVTQMISKTKKETKEKIETTAEPVKGWVENTSKTISETIQETEVAKQTKRLKKTVDKYIKDPQQNVYRPPGPIIPDNEMKALAEKEEALWKKQVRELHGKIEETTVYKAMADAKSAIQESNNPIIQKGLDVVDNITITASNVTNKVLGSTTEAQVREAIRKFVPEFDVEDFLPTLSQKNGMIYRFIQAQAANDVAALSTMCTETNTIRHTLIAERVKPEPLPSGHSRRMAILWVDDPDLLQTSFNDSNENPQLLVVFNVQCYEEIIDKAGNVVKGDPADCKAVKHIWVLQYDATRGWLVNEDVIGAREAIW